MSYPAEPPLVPLTDTLSERSVDRILAVGHPLIPMAMTPPSAQALEPVEEVGSLERSGRGLSLSNLNPARNFRTVGALGPIRSRMQSPTKLSREDCAVTGGPQQGGMTLYRECAETAAEEFSATSPRR